MGFSPHPPPKYPKPPPPKPLWKSTKRTKKEKKCLEPRLHTTYPSKILLFFHSLQKKYEFVFHKRPFLSNFLPKPYTIPSLTSRVHHPPSSTPYFLLITWCHRAPLSSTKRQFHLPKRAPLSLERHLTPKPPLLIYEHTIDHFMRWGLPPSLAC